MLGATGVVAGLFVTALGVGRTLAIVPVGWAGDRYDKRLVLLLSLALSTVAYASFAVVETSLGFIVARTLQGLGLVGTGMVSLALVGDLAAGDDRGRQIGKYNSWRMDAGITGSLGAGVLYDYFGFSPIFVALVGLFVLTIVGVWVFVPSDEPRVYGFPFFDLALNERILTVTSFRAQYAVSVTLVRNWVPIFAGLSVARGGLAMSGHAVGAVVAAEKFTNMLCQPVTGRISDRYGRGLFVAVGGAAYGLVALLVPLAPAMAGVLDIPTTVPVFGTVPAALFVLIGLNGLLGVADAIREPASMALFADEGKDSGIASSFGLRGLVWRPGALGAPVIGGYLMDSAGIAWVFVLGGGAALTGVVTFVGIVAARYGLGALARWWDSRSLRSTRRARSFSRADRGAAAPWTTFVVVQPGSVGSPRRTSKPCPSARPEFGAPAFSHRRPGGRSTSRSIYAVPTHVRLTESRVVPGPVGFPGPLDG